MKQRLFLLLAVFAMAGVFLYFQNNNMVVSAFDYKNAKIPSAFDGFVIVQISDLHNKSFGEDQKKLLDQVAALDPDLIVITGDFIDSRRYNLEKALPFAQGAVKLAPVYYVPGNHEARSGKYAAVRENLSAVGVTVLENTSIALERAGQSVELVGVVDPKFYGEDDVGEPILKGVIGKYSNPETFQIFLSHRPEYFETYVACELDLVFSGHAHGGQIRLPFVGGLYAPGQGVLPSIRCGGLCERRNDDGGEQRPWK